MEELQLDHEPSLDHWAKLIADDDIATGYHTSWSHAYESAWTLLEFFRQEENEDESV